MMNAFEIEILNFIRDVFSCKPLDYFFKYYTQLGGVAFMVGLSLVLIIFKKTRKIGLTVALALIMGITVNSLVLKKFFNRVRPYDFNKVLLIVKKEHDTSFPSGHSMAAFAAAFSVFWHNKKVGAIMLAGAFLIMFSRLYLYVHYPTDVLVGATVGILASILAKYISNKITEKYPKLF